MSRQGTIRGESSTDAVLERSAIELRRMIDQRVISARELMAATLKRIEARNPILNAFIALRADEALAEASRADEAVAAGVAVGPLHGIPIALKGLGDHKAGLKEHSGSRLLRDFVPTITRPHVARLERAGAIIVGTTNVPEFGHKGITDNLVSGPTSAPWHPGSNAGGSSGGSAAAVADFMVPLALGSDGGGSIRIPAAMCGVYGYKASFGRVPMLTRPDGFGNHAPFLHIGPITRSVADAELMLAVMAGGGARDPMSLPPLDIAEVAPASLSGLRVAYTPDYGGFPVDAAVREVVDIAVARFERAGAIVEKVDVCLPAGHEELAELWKRLIGVQNASVAEAHCRTGGPDRFALRDELTPEYAELLDLGRRVSAVDERLDQITRTAVFDAFEDVMDHADVMVGPTLSVAEVANRADGLTVGPTVVDGRDVDPLIGWCPTFLQNFTGHPAASVPAGRTSTGAPVGLQIMGGRFRDDVVLGVSKAFEAIAP
jgi:amidase/aspartyl-tRNA(Asn)/glutamyl-tRNA(Gln) amidotransferase subunit A